jgi:hypothetical protein
MTINWMAMGIATLIPLVLGFLWYSKMMFFDVWSASAGITMDDANKTNMKIVMPVLLLFSFFLSFALLFSAVHQWGLSSLMAIEGEAAKADLAMMMEKYGNNFRTFKHGAIHGFMSSIFLALPVISFHALFEGKKAKYILVHWGYWAVCMTLMSAVLCGMK